MYRHTTLDNGVRVVTQAVGSSRSCSLGVLINAGPRDEPADKAGLAHLAEHLAFAGTASRDALDVARVIDSAGGRAGGFVTRDYTCYAATVPDEYVPYALDLLGDVLLNSTYPEPAVAAQTAAVLRELDGAADQPDKAVHDRLKGRVWPGHPLGRPVAGTPNSVARLTREDVIYFVQANYLPDRMIVAAAGNVEHDDFVAQVRDGFWRLLGAGGPRPAVAPLFSPGVAVDHRPLNQAYFAVAAPAPRYDDPDRYSWHLLTALLGGGLSSRLFRRVREERGLAFHVAAEYHAYADAGLLVVEGATAPGDLPEVLGLIRDELRGLADGSRPVGDDELWRAKMQLRGQHLLGGEETHTLFSRLATQELYFGRHLPAGEVLDSIDRAGGADLGALAARWLGGPLAAAVAGPDAPPLSEARVRAALAPEPPPGESDGHRPEVPKELDRNPETARRAGERDRRQDRPQGRGDAEGVEAGRDRRVRQEVIDTAPSGRPA